MYDVLPPELKSGSCTYSELDFGLLPLSIVYDNFNPVRLIIVIVANYCFR